MSGSDLVNDRRFQNIGDLVRNLRSVLPHLTEAQSQLVGLYILNAVYLGEGEQFTTFPTLDEPKARGPYLVVNNT